MPDQPTYECFGTAWDATAVDCKGGYNPAMRAPDGTHIHPPCGYFNACQSKTLTTRATTKLLQIGRAPAATSPVAAPSPGLRPGTTATWPNPAQAPRPVALTPQPLPYAPLAQAPAPTPTHYAQPHPYVYPFLSVPEPAHEDITRHERFWWEVLRAALKAVFQTAAHFVDVTFFSPPAVPRIPPNAPPTSPP